MFPLARFFSTFFTVLAANGEKKLLTLERANGQPEPYGQPFCKIRVSSNILAVQEFVSDINFCNDHCDKTEVPDPLAVEDLFSYIVISHILNL